jgi:3-oxoisoapionate decarboxylase
LSRYNRCKSAVLEQWMEPEKNVEDTIGKEERWAQAGVSYLAQLPQFKQTNADNNVRNSK